ncbi:MAG: efflux RND transporter permease subunit [Gammaproteobacteria bacterium]|nr:efflux RND transporter permease subunit [Gammaproteobacteria bacterium]
MNLTDIFIRRPVLASVISLMILVLGVRSITLLELRQYPKTENTLITVRTTYPGASSELVKGFITTPLQQAIAEADGIDFLKASSKQGISVIEAYMELNYDPNAAIAEIQAKVASQRNVLPEEANDPVIDSQTGNPTALMYLAFYSDSMSPPEITDYLIRVVRPRLQAIPGVAKARMIGDKTYAMRIWLDPRRMAAMNVTAADVRRVLLANNYLSGAGETKGEYVAIDLSATTDISSVDEFRDLVVREETGVIVRLSDVARMELGAEDYESTAWYNGKTALFLGITPTPGANPLTVAERIHAEIPDISAQMPSGLKVFIPYDASEFIQESIEEVFTTLAQAVLIVLSVILLTLGSVRAAFIPAVALPLSLIGGAFLMLLMGFSINLLTLLALVLAIGLVVDDAIVIAENIHRHVEKGRAPLEAALVGARQLQLPIIAMTTTLIAVYAPIGFMGGLVGTLFTEFAFTLAGAVLISGVVALTLSPMLCSRVFKADKHGRFELLVERIFNVLADAYKAVLHKFLDFTSVVVVFGIAILVSIYFMFVMSQTELAPMEDQSIIFIMARGPQTATVEYDEYYGHRMVELFEDIPEYQESFAMLGFNNARNTIFMGFKMPPTSQRERAQWEVQNELQQKLFGITGLQVSTFGRPSLPSPGRGLPVQFVVTSAADYEALDGVVDELLGRAMQSGRFMFLQKSVEFNRPKATILIDRNRAGVLGIRMDDLGQELATLLGGNHVNWFNLEGRSYKVIPQVERKFRASQDMLDDYYVRTGDGKLVSLSTIVSFERSVEPSERLQFQQLNAVILEGVPAEGVAMGDALDYLETTAREIFPENYSWDYAGESRQYTQQGSALMTTFFVALLVIYLVLAAQFESWRDPLIILMSVPMSIAGAMIFIALGFATSNIYTQVGLITLIGLITKNGILIVEFANQVQIVRGLPKREAIEEAARIRLRPILMTTISMIVAMVPLLTASGPGAVSRFHIGLVIASGLGIGTVFTLFVVPAFYLLLARDHSADAARQQIPAVQETIA